MRDDKIRFTHQEAINLLHYDQELEKLKNCNRRLILALRFENYDRVLSLANEIIYRAYKLKGVKNGRA